MHMADYVSKLRTTLQQLQQSDPRQHWGPKAIEAEVWGLAAPEKGGLPMMVRMGISEGPRLPRQTKPLKKGSLVGIYPAGGPAVGDPLGWGIVEGPPRKAEEERATFKNNIVDLRIEWVPAGPFPVGALVGVAAAVAALEAASRHQPDVTGERGDEDGNMHNYDWFKEKHADEALQKWLEARLLPGLSVEVCDEDKDDADWFAGGWCRSTVWYPLTQRGSTA